MICFHVKLKMEPTAEKLNLAILRLAAEQRVERLQKQNTHALEKLLWEYHQAELRYIEDLEEYRKILGDAKKKELTAVFQEQLEQNREKLNGDRVKVEVVQKLVQQLEGRSHNFHINARMLKEDQSFAKIDEATEDCLRDHPALFNGAMLKELCEFARQTDELKVRVEKMQNNICQTSDGAMKSTADLIEDVLS